MSEILTPSAENSSPSEQSNMHGQALLENLSDTMRTHEFIIFRPGGNDTAFIKGVPADPTVKQQLNDRILTVYHPQVEQVWFIDENPDNPTLMMAGGEFCGNATRSFAYSLLGGKPGQVSVTVSGVDHRLQAGVTEQGHARAQMPIFASPEKITQIDDHTFFAEMQGISHFVVFDKTPVKREDFEEIRDYQAALKDAASLYLKKSGIVAPALWVMYVTQNGDALSMEPIVFVPWAGENGTLYYETACGSGTTAVWLTLAAKSKTSVTTNITQPSGMPITVTIDYDADKDLFDYAKISWPVERLQQGIIDKGLTANFVTEYKTHTESLEKDLDTGLIHLYQDLFGQEPYFESFEEEEVREIFRTYFAQGTVHIARDTTTPIGFIATTPLSAEPEITEILEESWFFRELAKDSAVYLADLGVATPYQRKGIAKMLVNLIMKPEKPWSVIILRTSINNTSGLKLYKSLKFEEIPHTRQLKTGARVDGQTTTDERIFLYLVK